MGTTRVLVLRSDVLLFFVRVLSAAAGYHPPRPANAKALCDRSGRIESQLQNARQYLILAPVHCTPVCFFVEGPGGVFKRIPRCLDHINSFHSIWKVSAFVSGLDV